MTGYTHYTEEYKEQVKSRAIDEIRPSALGFGISCRVWEYELGIEGTAPKIYCKEVFKV